MTPATRLKRNATAATIAFMGFVGCASGTMVHRLVAIGAGHDGASVVATLAGLGVFATGTLAFLGAMVLAGQIRISVVE